MTWTHDVVVIGAGAAGLTAAGGCARLGLRVALVERDRMGGECLHVGCVPSKALLAAAHRAAAMRGSRLGVTAAAPPVIDFAAVRAHVAAAIAAIASHDGEARFVAWGVEVVRGSATLAGRHVVQVGDRLLAAPRIVLATGSDPAVPPIPGLADTPFLTNETLFALELLPEHLVVLGGGSTGVEMAQAFRRLGAAVTLVDHGTMLHAADDEARAVVRNALAADGVAILEHTHIAAAGASAEGGAIRLDRADGGAPIRGSHLLVAAGRRPRLDGLGLERAGIAAGSDGIAVDRSGRTTNRAVFAIGDCRAGPRFTHAAGHEGAVAVSRIGYGLPSRTRGALLPSVTYTDPELAQLGVTEAEARARGGRVRVSRATASDNDRAVAEGDTAGFLKLVHAGRGTLVGVTIVGKNAGELLLPWSLVLGGGRARAWSLADAIVAYPTRSELSKAAAFGRFEPALFGPAARRWARLLARLRRSETRGSTSGP